jgi:GNAT superfamily N-acetyltransferase
MEGLAIVPANEASLDDFAVMLGTRGTAQRCWCQRFRLERGEAFGNFPVEERAARLAEQTNCGDDDADETSGLVAYLDGEPVGWTAVAPRADYGGLLRTFRVPWEGRDEDRTDRSVWALTCLFVRAGFRRRGISRALAAAAVPFARDRGARALEAYPILTTAVIEEELLVGTEPTFTAAGLRVVSRPSPRRAVMRIDFA